MTFNGNPMRIIPLRSICLVSFLFFTGGSFALSQIFKNDTIPEVGLPEVDVSALRLPFKESTVPYGISLISSRINTPGLSLAENLAGLPGLQVNARYNYAVGDRITNRGFGARTQFGVRGVRILLDDIPVTFADGQSNLEIIDLQNLALVEFLRGPGSSLYGNASGGVLLLHSKEITGDKFLASVSSTVGSDGLFKWNGTLEGNLGKSSFSGNYSDFRYSGFRDHSSARYERAFLKLISNPTSKDNLLFEGGIVKFDALNPGSLTKEESTLEPEIANPASVSNAAGENGNQVQFAATWKHQADSSSLLKLAIYGVHRSVDNPIIGKIVILPQFSGGTTATYNSTISIANRIANWSAGVDIASRFNNRKNYVNVSGQKGNITIDQNEQVICTGVFLQALYPAAKRLSIDASLRYDLSYFGVQNKLFTDTGNGKGSRTMKSFDPSIGLIYRLFKNMRFFANISTSFETPTSTELVNRPDGAGGFNPDLSPSRALEYESGVRGYINPLITYDITAYLIHTKDELIPFQIESAPGQDYYRNAGTTMRRGGELTFRLRPVPLIDINASLTYIDATYNKFTVDAISYSGKMIPGINKVHGVAELKINSKGLYFTFLMESFGKMYVNDANSESTANYTRFDLGIGSEGLSFGKKQVNTLIISGGISNLFNIHYITAVTVNAAANRFYEPGPERTFYLNTRFNFGVK
jgi:iron complex outermembrane recepter protein